MSKSRIYPSKQSSQRPTWEHEGKISEVDFEEQTWEDSLFWMLTQSIIGVDWQNRVATFKHAKWQIWLYNTVKNELSIKWS